MTVNAFEELVKTYVQSKGYFTIENLPFALPKTVKIDEVFKTGPSDIDLLAYKPAAKNRRLLAISCKGHPDGFDLDKLRSAILDPKGAKKINGKDAWRAFRELANDRWAGAFCGAINRRLDQGTKADFVYVTAFVKFTGDEQAWCNEPKFVERMGGHPLEILTLETIWKNLTVASSNQGYSNETVRQLIALFKPLEAPQKPA